MCIVFLRNIISKIISWAKTFHENKRGREREREREWERTEKHRNINKVMPKVQERDRE